MRPAHLLTKGVSRPAGRGLTPAANATTLGTVFARDRQTEAGQQELVCELAELALERLAPEELGVLPETAEEYFRDPRSVLAPRRRDEAIGFGLDLALLTPYVLAVATPVLGVLGEIAQQTLADSSARMIRRLFRRGDTPDGPALTAPQAGQVRDVAFEHARALGLDDGRAALLADSIVGGLAVR
jgi:hypothetical protein